MAKIANPIPTMLVLTEQIHDSPGEALGNSLLPHPVVIDCRQQEHEPERLPRVHIVGQTIDPGSLVSPNLFQRRPEFFLPYASFTLSRFRRLTATEVGKIGVELSRTP